MAKLLNMAVIMAIFLVIAAPLAVTASEQDTQAQLKALEMQIKSLQEQSQKQVSALQVQVDALKKQLVQQAEETDNALSKVELRAQQPVTKKGFGRAPEPGGGGFLVRKPRKRTGIMSWMQKNKEFRVGDAMGFDEESPVNIAFEINTRYRQNVYGDASNPGFQFYELGIIGDAELNDWTAGYFEYNLHHSVHSEPEDVWIDLHLPDGDKAFAGGTGLKIGHFHAPFGWDNDDCEGSFYGGRTSINEGLIRDQRFEGQKLRERQEGIQANYNWEAGDDLRVILSGGVFNGNGDSLHYGGKDNDRKKDWVGRVEAQFLNTALGASYWYSPGTSDAVANVNDTTHVRDLHRVGVHFKYPNDVSFPGGDPSFAGGDFLIWGEAMYAHAEADSSLTGFQYDVDGFGAYLEGDVPIIKEKLLGFCRLDYWNPDIDNGGKSDIIGVTPGIYLTLWPGLSVMTLEYEFYQGGTQNKNDRIATELQIFF